MGYTCDSQFKNYTKKTNKEAEKKYRTHFYIYNDLSLSFLICSTYLLIIIFIRKLETIIIFYFHIHILKKKT